MGSVKFAAKKAELDAATVADFMESEQRLMIRQGSDEVVLDRTAMYRLYQYLDGYYRTTGRRARARTSTRA